MDELVCHLILPGPGLLSEASSSHNVAHLVFLPFVMLILVTTMLTLY